MNCYYVYILLNPLKPKISSFKYKEYEINVEFEIFYIGKGKGKRDRSHLKYSALKDEKNPHKTNTIKKILSTGLEPIIKRPFRNLTSDEAYNLEEIFELIIGRRIINKGPLTNLVPGGKNRPCEQWVREKISKAKINHPAVISPEGRQRTIEALKEFWNIEGNREKRSIEIKERWKINGSSTKQKENQKNLLDLRRNNPEMQEAITTKIKEFYNNNRHTKQMYVYQYDLDGNLIEKHEGVNQAAYKTGLQRANISKAINNKKNTNNAYKGFIWLKYLKGNLTLSDIEQS